MPSSLAFDLFQAERALQVRLVCGRLSLAVSIALCLCLRRRHPSDMGLEAADRRQHCRRERCVPSRRKEARADGNGRKRRKADGSQRRSLSERERGNRSEREVESLSFVSSRSSAVGGASETGAFAFRKARRRRKGAERQVASPPPGDVPPLPPRRRRTAVRRRGRAAALVRAAKGRRAVDGVGNLSSRGPDRRRRRFGAAEAAVAASRPSALCLREHPQQSNDAAPDRRRDGKV